MTGIILLLGLATWRLTSLVLFEPGPFRVFAKLRHLVGVNKPGEITGLRELFTCPWCMSVWLGAFIAYPAALYFDDAAIMLTTFSSSAITVAIDKVIRYGRS